MCPSSCRLPPAHFRNGAGTIRISSYVNHVLGARRKGARARAAFLPSFYAVFCFARRSFSLESAPEFAVGDLPAQRRQEKRRPTNGEGSHEVAGYSGYC